MMRLRTQGLPILTRRREMLSRTRVAISCALVRDALLADDPARGQRRPAACASSNVRIDVGLLPLTRDRCVDFACVAGKAYGISPIMRNRADQVVSLWRRSV